LPTFYHIKTLSWGVNKRNMNEGKPRAIKLPISVQP
jgi:hypothetical protein